jgi:hypothetical protein
MRAVFLSPTGQFQGQVNDAVLAPGQQSLTRRSRGVQRSTDPRRVGPRHRCAPPFTLRWAHRSIVGDGAAVGLHKPEKRV